MPKMKTHKAAAKRLRLTGTGKVVRRKAFKSHILEKKSPGRKRRLGRQTTVAEPDLKRVRRMLGGS
jgi:large subunit ribosomal protein L35